MLEIVLLRKSPESEVQAIFSLIWFNEISCRTDSALIFWIRRLKIARSMGWPEKSATQTEKCIEKRFLPLNSFAKFFCRFSVRVFHTETVRKAPATFNFLRHVMRAIWSVRPKCSHRCVSLKGTSLKPMQILNQARNQKLSRAIRYENEMA